jgi:NAD(P)-dependent dehydrogenase (short-subunit alcohol dehydrogenase family)
MELGHKRALVTGGAMGIGGAVARRLAAEGAQVVIADLDGEAGRATADELGAGFVRADLATQAGVHEMMAAARQRLGGLDVLVNNAGGVEGPTYPEAPASRWMATLALNLHAVMLATQQAVELMGERGGAVVMIGSVAGLGSSPHAAPEYAVAKAGVLRLTGCLAPLHSQLGIRVNCVCPGLVDTPSSRRAHSRLSAEELAALPPALPAAELADAVVELLGDDALAGRVLVCKAGEPRRLLPVVDWRSA